MSDATRKRLLERKPDGKHAHPYTKSGETDVASTFRRIRRQMKEAEALKQSANVKSIKTARVAK
jgi:hypothetical protein